MHHDDCTNHTGCHAPACLVYILELVFLIGILDAKRMREAVTEVMAGARLQCLPIMHQGFNGKGVCCTCKAFLFCFFALYNGDCQYITAEIRINIQHLDGSFLCLLCGCVCGMTLLPQKFHGSQEGACCFFPTNNGAPLIIQLGQVSVGLHDVCIMLAEQGFGSGTNTNAFLQLLFAAVGYPCNLGRKAFYMILFLLQQAFGDEHRHIYIFYACFLEAVIQLSLQKLPDGIAIRADDHAALQAGICRQVSFFYNVRIPLGKIHFHIGDGFYKFLFFCHLISSLKLFCTENF